MKTNTNTDQELREKLANLLVRYGVSVIERSAFTPMREQIDPATEEIIALIKADRQKQDIESRIDELEWLLQEHDAQNSFGYFIEDRLKQLKETQ